MGRPGGPLPRTRGQDVYPVVPVSFEDTVVTYLLLYLPPHLLTYLLTHTCSFIYLLNDLFITHLVPDPFCMTRGLVSRQQVPRTNVLVGNLST